MKTWWKEHLIASVVLKYIQTHEIQTIITFDMYGISSHPNHRALFFGVRYIVRTLQGRNETILGGPGKDGKQGTIGEVKGYALLTVGVLRKFSGVLDLGVTIPSFVSYLLRRQFLQPSASSASATSKQATRDALLGDFENGEERVLFLSGVSQVLSGRSAMYEHKSQLVWFRHLYLVFSRYMVVNELKRIR
jgi:N-acetylglucosaminylphosphatidylinositol deacetylase